MITVNDITFWILVWGIELLILEFVIVRPQLKNKDVTHKQKTTIAVIIIIVIATQLSLISYTGLYLLESKTNYCMAYEITRVPINETRVFDCVTKGDETKFQFFTITLIMTVTAMLAQIWQLVEDNRSPKKNQE